MSRRSELDHLVLKTLDAWIPAGSDVALFDVPVHRNAGDLFIYAVLNRVLAQRGCRVVHRAGVRDYRSGQAQLRVGASTVVVGLGGGNFGDRYPRYQALRERVVADFPANRIVILPQTIHFDDGRSRAQAERRLSRHPDLRIAVRDRLSLGVAGTFTTHTALLPDLVEALGPPAVRGTGGSGRTIRLMRRDAEVETSGPHECCTHHPQRQPPSCCVPGMS